MCHWPLQGLRTRRQSALFVDAASVLKGIVPIYGNARARTRELGCRGINGIGFSRLAGPGASEHPESVGDSNCSALSLPDTPAASQCGCIIVIGNTGLEANSSHHSTYPSHGLDVIEIEDTGSEASGSGHSSYSSTSLTSHIKETMWTYFDTDEDFTLALLLDKANMKDILANKFIDLFHCCIMGRGRFTVSSVADIEAAWERAWANTTSMDNILCMSIYHMFVSLASH
ncbi:hypothetical protein BC827DRAFT_1158546 [Russula dissimulans]|nr:hypothetical protein BC827DRAFT_1158546 [Russula dissimulans]